MNGGGRKKAVSPLSSCFVLFWFHFDWNQWKTQWATFKCMWGWECVVFLSVCVRAWVCVCLWEAQWVGESGSAGTHSCFMVLFQEELLDLCVFTGSQFVCLSLCIFASTGYVGCWSRRVHPPCSAAPTLIWSSQHHFPATLCQNTYFRNIHGCVVALSNNVA